MYPYVPVLPDMGVRYIVELYSCSGVEEERKKRRREESAREARLEATKGRGEQKAAVEGK